MRMGSIGGVGASAERGRRIRVAATGAGPPAMSRRWTRVARHTSFRPPPAVRTGEPGTWAGMALHHRRGPADTLRVNSGCRVSSSRPYRFSPGLVPRAHGLTSHVRRRSRTSRRSRPSCRSRHSRPSRPCRHRTHRSDRPAITEYLSPHPCLSNGAPWRRAPGHACPIRECLAPARVQQDLGIVLAWGRRPPPTPSSKPSGCSTARSA